MRTYIKALLLIALLFLAITFGTQNSVSVTLCYYFGLISIPIPLYLVIYIAIIVGIIAGMVVGISTRATLKGKVKKLEKVNTSLQEELEKMQGEAAKEAAEEPEVVPAHPEVGQTKALPSQEVPPEEEETVETESIAQEPDRHRQTRETPDPS